MKKTLAITLLALIAVNAFADTEAQKAFAKLKTLVGTWEEVPEAKGGMEIKVVFKITGAGSALVETQFPGTEHEMVSIYHMDGPDKLVLTHYCASQNQPTMQYKGTDKDGHMKFDFIRGTSMSAKDMHMHSVVYDKIEGDRFTSTWSAWMDGKYADSVKFDMMRVK